MIIPTPFNYLQQIQQILSYHIPRFINPDIIHNEIQITNIANIGTNKYELTLSGNDDDVVYFNSIPTIKNIITKVGITSLKKISLYNYAVKFQGRVNFNINDIIEFKGFAPNDWNIKFKIKNIQGTSYIEISPMTSCCNISDNIPITQYGYIENNLLSCSEQFMDTFNGYNFLLENPNLPDNNNPNNFYTLQELNFKVNIILQTQNTQVIQQSNMIFNNAKLCFTHFFVGNDERVNAFMEDSLLDYNKIEKGKIKGVLKMNPIETKTQTRNVAVGNDNQTIPNAFQASITYDDKISFIIYFKTIQDIQTTRDNSTNEITEVAGDITLLEAESYALMIKEALNNAMLYCMNGNINVGTFTSYQGKDHKIAYSISPAINSPEKIIIENDNRNIIEFAYNFELTIYKNTSNYQQNLLDNSKGVLYSGHTITNC